MSEAPATARVVFMPSGRSGEFPLDTPLLDAARQLEVDLHSICGGRAICGRCQIGVRSGALDEHAVHSSPRHLGPATEAERTYERVRGLAGGRRLACQAVLRGDLVVDVPATSQAERPFPTGDEPASAERRIDPVVKLYYVELTRPSAVDRTGDLTRLLQSLAMDWGVRHLEADLTFVQRLSPALRAGDARGGDWKSTVAVRDRRDLVAVWPGFRDRAYGLAIDVGTTTLAGYLCDLESGEIRARASMLNPQIRFGEDPTSRIAYAQQVANGAAVLTRCVRDALGELIGVLARQARIAPAEIVEATVVGNPTMHHLALGIDPTQLGLEPFPLVTDRESTVFARELGLDINPGARVYFLPCIAGHLGADTTAVLLSQGLHASEETTLILDVGATTEIVLGNRERIVATAIHTGPAFEGTAIRCGQRATPGAIERVRIDRSTLRPRFKVVGCERWSDEPGFEGALPASGVTGICGSGIVEAVAELHLAGVVDARGRMQANGNNPQRHPHLVPSGRNVEYRLYGSSGREIRVSPADVRAIQLAKSACYAGAKLLMEEMGMSEVDRIVLTGAYGNNIDVRHAMTIGMIPDCALERVRGVGHAAGAGARIALLRRAARWEAEDLVRRVERIESATRPRFQDHFLAAMGIPHAEDAFPLMKAALAGGGC